MFAEFRHEIIVLYCFTGKISIKRIKSWLLSYIRTRMSRQEVKKLSRY